MPKDLLGEEIAAIHRLSDDDMRSSKASDFAALKEVVTRDAVMMPPGGGFQRGEARERAMDAAAQAMAGIEVISYEERFEETLVFDGPDGRMAVEWGTLSGSMRARGSPDVEEASYK